MSHSQAKPKPSQRPRALDSYPSPYLLSLSDLSRQCSLAAQTPCCSMTSGTLPPQGLSTAIPSLRMHFLQTSVCMACFLSSFPSLLKCHPVNKASRRLPCRWGPQSSSCLFLALFPPQPDHRLTHCEMAFVDYLHSQVPQRQVFLI